MARRTFAKAATGSLKNMIPKRENVSSKLLGGKGWTEASATMTSACRRAGSSDPFTRPGDRWLGDICAKDMTARADMLRQLKNCRARAAPNIEYALARLGRRQIQQLLG